MRKAVKVTLIALFWVLVWQIIALLIGNVLLFPDPLTVVKRLCQMVITSTFWLSLSTSLLRVMIGIIIAIFAGTVLAILSSRLKFLYELLFPMMTIIKATPVASFIILIVIFIGRDTVPTVISLLMVMPVIWTNVYEGILNIDKDLKEVCTLYKFSAQKRLQVLYFPSVMPYFTSAVLSSIGLGWKAGIAAEILYPPIESIGRAILESKQLLLTEDLFAWTLVVIMLSFTFEVLLKLALKQTNKKKRVTK